MNQICYNIFETLNTKTHIREIARLINSNQMTVSRRLKEMQKNNLVDFITQGKNKYYFKKKSIETLLFAKQNEMVKTANFIKENPQFRAVIEEILLHQEIEFAIIFGSYVKKTATKTSDLDIFCENIPKSIIKEIELLNSTVSIKTGKFNPDSVLAKEIQKRCIIIKGADKIEQVYPEIM